jgi:hypothetical protein
MDPFRRSILLQFLSRPSQEGSRENCFHVPQVGSFSVLRVSTHALLLNLDETE